MLRRSSYSAPLSIAVLFAAFGPASAQDAIPATSEFLVNTITSGFQQNPDVSGLSDGSFVVVWSDASSNAGGDYEVLAARFSSTGVRLGIDFRVNTFTQQGQTDPHVGSDAAGGFVVVWFSNYGSATVMAQRFAASGQKTGGEFQVNLPAGDSRNPDIAVRPSGPFLVVWSDSPGAGDADIRARPFDAAGVAQASELQVNSFTPGIQSEAAVAVDGSGNFVVVWSSYPEGSFYGIFAQRLDSAGSKVGTEFRVNNHTTQHEFLPVVAAAPNGDFAIVWNGYDAGTAAVLSRRYSSAGEAQASELQVNALGPFDQRRPAIATLRNGDFMVAYESNQEGSGAGVFARRLTSNGGLGPEFPVNTYITGVQSHSTVAADALGGFALAWDGENQDGQFHGVFARRFATLAPLDVDGNGSTDALTDGLLTLRYHFGFTGATLINNAVGDGCTRCTPEAILAYLQSKD